MSWMRRCWHQLFTALRWLANLDNVTFRHKEFIDLRDLNEEELPLLKLSTSIHKADGNMLLAYTRRGVAMPRWISSLAGGESANFSTGGGPQLGAWNPARRSECTVCR